MKLLDPGLLGLWCGCMLMLFAAVEYLWSQKVPNRLTYPAICSGWIAAAVVGWTSAIPSHGGNFFSSFVAAAFAFVLLVPLWRKTGLGAGCVKMQAAFGAWTGVSLDMGSAMVLVLAATLIAVALTIAAAFAYSVVLPKDRRGEGPAPLFPAQVTMSIGTVCTSVVAAVCGRL